MWQRATFDELTIARELGWAAAIGFNSCRVFLPYLVWEDDAVGLLDRIDRFLDLADRNGLTTTLILFDDCAFANREPYLGPQDEPVPGVHNSGWTPSPGHTRVVDRSAWPSLKAYVASVIGRFRDDRRVLCWDLYNEPGNGGQGERSLPLLQATVAWARAAAPTQPLTVGVWSADLPELSQLTLAESDVVSFHDYGALDATQAQMERFEALGRPLLCTEWMRRGFGSHFDTHLPVFQEHRIGCWFWGLVNGRTQTHISHGARWLARYHPRCGSMICRTARGTRMPNLKLTRFVQSSLVPPPQHHLMLGEWIATAHGRT